MSITRPLRALITLVTSTVLVTAGVSCGVKDETCPVGTASFPITGAVVKKSTPVSKCYLLHVRRDDSTVTETVRVSRYRYLHVEVLGRVTYSAEPTN